MTSIYLDGCAALWFLFLIRREKREKLSFLDSHYFFTLKKKINTLHDITKSNSVDVKILVQIFHTVTDFEFISIKSPVASF